MPTQRDRSQTNKSDSLTDESEASTAARPPDSSQAISAGLINLIPDNTRQAFLNRALELIASYFSCDIVEINLMDESLGCFLPVRWVSARGRSFIRGNAAYRYQLGEGYTGWLAEHGTPLLITDTSSYPDLEPKGGL
ncbi:MAG: hypothetical protein MUP44_05580, partial [Anaerolineales bacterium]|nr:hypothetical protein [Anaerolineales bacterium]